MSNDIKPGDRVMVVRARPCCGSLDQMGKVATVNHFGLPDGKIFGYCPICRDEVWNPLLVATFSDGSVKHICRLQKLPPLTEGESLPTRRDLEVPA